MSENNVKANGIYNELVDLLIVCDECGHTINAFVPLSDFIDLNEPVKK